MPKQKAIKWHKTNSTTWVSNAERSAGYVGTVTLSSNIYTLLVAPGGYTSASTTLKNAKGDFRKYLRDK